MGLKLQGFLDPLQEGAPTLQEGTPTYKIARFSQKKCMKLRNFWSVGGGALSRLDPPLPHLVGSEGSGLLNPPV